MSCRLLLPALVLALAACDNNTASPTNSTNSTNSAQAQAAAGEVNVYSSRHYDTDVALYEQFTENTGIKVNLIEGKSDALIERIRSEGEFSPADLLITVDAGTLWRAEQAQVFAPVQSDILNERVPANLRDPNNHWFGLSKRARVIVHNASVAGDNAPDQYEDLSDPVHKGTVCMRSSSNIYNLSLLGSLVEHLGRDAATAWATGVVANFARSPQGNDTAQLKAVAVGECGITIANTYYLGRLLGSTNPDDQAIAEALTVVFPNQSDRGTHVNISGAGVTRHAPNRANGIAFLEYLTSDFAQKLFAEGNNEYPVQGPATGPVATLGNFAEDQISAGSYGLRQAEAVQIFDEAGWQ